MIRIRQSYLDAFRRVVDTEYGREDQLVRAIQGKADEPNWMMQAGTAWHDVLADRTLEVYRGVSPQNLPKAVPSGDYRFGLQDVLAARCVVGPGLWEVPGSLVLPVMLGSRTVDVSLECTADHIRGLVLTDHKCKFTPADPGDYEASIQWRAYLLVHGAEVFRYMLWSFKDPKDGYCALEGVYSFRLWRYGQLEADVTWWASRFLSWAADHRLLRDLERDPYATVAA